MNVYVIIYRSKQTNSKGVLKHLTWVLKVLKNNLCVSVNLPWQGQMGFHRLHSSSMHISVWNEETHSSQTQTWVQWEPNRLNTPSIYANSIIVVIEFKTQSEKRFKYRFSTSGCYKWNHKGVFVGSLVVALFTSECPHIQTVFPSRSVNNQYWPTTSRITSKPWL